MTSSALDLVPSGEEVFLDATIFIYHFTGASAECRRLLDRCERRDLRGITSLTALAEVSHRLMMIEAVSRSLVSSSNVVRKLREHPEIVRRLSTYRRQVEAIPSMGVEILDAERTVFRRALSLQEKYGLLTNDSLLAGTALEQGIENLATADLDFERVIELKVYLPLDLGRHNL